MGKKSGTGKTTAKTGLVRIQLDPVKIRYSGSVPSMSRRGGVRLNPVTDGTIDHQRAQASIARLDHFGGKLVDVVSPTTGLFTHVRSAMTSPPVNPAGCTEMKSGVNGSPNSETRDADYRASTVRAGQHAGLTVYTDQSDRVVRTTDMGENPLPVSVVSAPTKPVKERRRVSARAPKPAKPIVPGGTGPRGSVTDDDVTRYVRAAAKADGLVVTVITPTMMRDGREALKIKRKQAELAMQEQARLARARAASSPRSPSPPSNGTGN